MTTTTQSIESKSSGFPLTGWVVLIVLTLIGLGAWIYQLVSGMQVTSLGQQVVWGLYIAAFFTSAAIGAGLLALVGLSEFQPIVALANRAKLLAIALASFIITALLVLVDIGNPLQAWRLITAFRFNAMMTWDFWALLAAGVVALVYLLAVRQSAKAQKVLGVLGILAAFALVLIEGLMLAETAARPMWGGMTLFAFLLGAVIAGLAMALWVLGKKAPAKLSSWLGVALVISFFIVLAEIIAGLATASPRTLDETRNLLVGGASPFFWMHVLLGLLLPIGLIAFAKGKAWAGWIAGLALLGVLAEKLWLLAAGQAEPWLPLGKADYMPNWVEFLVVIGMIAFGWLIYQLAVILFKVDTKTA